MLNRFVAAEQPIAELDTKIQELDRILDAQSVPEDALTDAREQRDQLVAQRDDMLRDIFTSLSPWDKVLLARHPQRPYTLDYIQEMCDSFDE
ncbi:MAG: acetyl-CoA carboxylase carboxyl transferase subunit alpha, partial [Armatimonadetes bacterium]|nr:acetyl-CoA carboxylase carboxyl transferase subunit alpha [Armatimonadota bacterium]